MHRPAEPRGQAQDQGLTVGPLAVVRAALAGPLQRRGRVPGHRGAGRQPGLLDELGRDGDRPEQQHAVTEYQPAMPDTQLRVIEPGRVDHRVTAVGGQQQRRTGRHLVSSGVRKRHGLPPGLSARPGPPAIARPADFEDHAVAMVRADIRAGGREHNGWQILSAAAVTALCCVHCAPPFPSRWPPGQLRHFPAPRTNPEQDQLSEFGAPAGARSPGRPAKPASHGGPQAVGNFLARAARTAG